GGVVDGIRPSFGEARPIERRSRIGYDHRERRVDRRDRGSASPLRGASRAGGPVTRLFSWNVNGVRASAGKGLFDWLAKESPDVLSIQETKASSDQLLPEFLSPPDGRGGAYHGYWASAKRKGYSGVAIFSKREPRSISFLGDGAY